MGIIFRNGLGRPLTTEEHDNNWRYLHTWNAANSYLDTMYVEHNDILYKANGSVGVGIEPGTPAATGLWIPISGAGGGGAGTLGDPTDLQYGISLNPPDVQNGDTVEDAFDKVISFLELIAPPLPPQLSSVNLVISSTWSAKEQNTTTTFTNITDDTTPTAVVDSVFWDGASGTLDSFIETNGGGQTNIGSISLTTGDDSGTNGALTITQNTNYPVSPAGPWLSINAQITSTTALSLNNDEHVYTMTHSKTGSTSTTFYIEELVTPAIVGSPSYSISYVGGPRYISGVPSLEDNDIINVTFDVADAVKWYYNNSRIGAVDSPNTDGGQIASPLPGTGPVKDSTVTNTSSLTVSHNTYAQGIAFTLYGYNSRGTLGSDIGTSTYNTDLYVDTKSNEAIRVNSGAGQYPSTGYGSAYDSTLNIDNMEELQLRNALFEYPNIDFSVYTPAGPDYSTLTFTGTRWATFNIGSITNAPSIIFQIQNATGFGSNRNVSGLSLYLRVDGANGTSGWIDCNSNWPLGTNPTNDGDPALVADSDSTATQKKITFGPGGDKTGTVYVRIGWSAGGGFKFSNIVKV